VRFVKKPTSLEVHGLLGVFYLAVRDLGLQAKHDFNFHGALMLKSLVMFCD